MSRGSATIVVSSDDVRGLGCMRKNDFSMRVFLSPISLLSYGEYWFESLFLSSDLISKRQEAFHF